LSRRWIFHDAFGVGIRVRVDEDGVDYGEDGGGGADAESQGEDAGQSETGTFAEFAAGVAKVRNYGLHRHLDAGESLLNGDALETSMHIEFSVDVQRNKNIGSPRVENNEYLMAVGPSGSVDDAFRVARGSCAPCRIVPAARRRLRTQCRWGSAYSAAFGGGHKCLGFLRHAFGEPHP
jgi:hypothetical protein